MSTTDKLAVAAFVLGLVLAAWELMKFWQEGARVRVKMRPGVLEDGALMTMGHPSSGHPGKINKRGLRFGIEVALIEVENRGRSAVTIKDVALDLGRTNRWKLGRRTAMFQLLKFDGCETETRIRLEQYDSATFLINMNHALWAVRGDASKPLSVRASARVVGKRTVRSSWLKRWRFAADTPPRIWLDEPFDLAREIYRYLYKSLPESAELARLFLPEIAMKIAEHIESGETLTRQSIEEVLKGALDAFKINEPLTTSWAYDLVSELEKPNGPFDASSAQRRRLARGFNEEPTAQPGATEPSNAGETVADGHQ